MALMHTPICDFGAPALDFKLLGVDGKHWTCDECAGENGLLVMFICNHCPYVKAIQERLVADVSVLQKNGIGVVGIMPNDPNDYPEDAFENMQKIAKKKATTFRI